MKLIVPDIHNKWPIMAPTVESICEKHDVEHIVFLGDYVNDWRNTPEEEILAVKSLTQWVSQHRDSVRMEFLEGNHDFPYLLPYDHPLYYRVTQFYSPGFQPSVKDEVQEELLKLDIKVATVITSQGKDYLLTHAGVVERWVNTYLPHVDTENPHEIAETVNLLRKQDVTPFVQCGPERGGIYGVDSSPLWAGLKELQENPAYMYQIVGHTPVRSLTWRNDDTLCYVDTWSTYSNKKPIGDRSFLLLP